MADILRGHEIQDRLEGFRPYFDVDPTAAYAGVEFEVPETGMVIARHFTAQSHVLTDEAAQWVMAIGRGVGDANRPQYAVFLSDTPPPTAILYERINP